MSASLPTIRHLPRSIVGRTPWSAADAPVGLPLVARASACSDGFSRRPLEKQSRDHRERFELSA
jgi:hypothetical protein